MCSCALSPHDGIACCRCCGTIYVVESGRLGLSTCSEHSRECAHIADLWELHQGSRDDMKG